MNYFPLELFENIVKFAINKDLLDSSQIKKLKDFSKQISNISSDKLEQLQKEDYISDLFSKNEFLELYCLFLNYNDKIIQDLFVEASFANIEKLVNDESLINEQILNINNKIFKIIEKHGCFVFPPSEGSQKLIISLPLDRLVYNEITKAIGVYKLVLSYPYDVFKICQKIVEKIGQKKFEDIIFITAKDIVSLDFRSIKEESNKSQEIEIEEIKLEINIEKAAQSKVWESKKEKLDNLLKKKKFFIIGSPSTNDKEVIEAFIRGGVQAIKLHFNMIHPVSKQKMESYEKEKDKVIDLILQYPNVIWGIVPGNLMTNPQDFEEISTTELESFFDFVDLFYHSYTPYYLDVPISKMVAIDKVLNKEQLEPLKKYRFFAIEAAVVRSDNYGLPLTLEDIINYKAIAESTDIPVFVATQKRITPKDVITLYNIGVRGLVLGQVVTSTQKDKIQKVVYEFLEVASKL